MTQDNKTAEIVELEDLITKCDANYYRDGSSSLPDAEYDAHKAKLRQLHPGSLVLQSLGEDHSEGFVTYKHSRPMLSLDKIHEKDVEDLSERYADALAWMRKFPAGTSFILEPKIDGCAIDLYYKDWKLERAVTRGAHGIAGDDVKRNVDCCVPATIPTDLLPAEIHIRGELYMTFETFAAINTQQEEAGLEVYKNPRNLCAGTMKSKVPTGRPLKFIAHGVGEPLAGFGDSIMGVYAPIRQSGLQTSTSYAMVVPAGLPDADVAGIIARMKTKTYEFPTDGVVIKPIETRFQDLLGEGSHHPNWAIALKFLPEQKEVTVIGIKWQVGKTGVLTPVLDLEPVILAGTEVTAASGFNAGYIAASGIGPGAVVVLQKSGEIIPYVVRVVKESEEKLPHFIECPECGKPCALDRKVKDGALQYICDNAECPGKVKARLLFAFGPNGLKVDGFGAAMAESIISNGLEKCDLYTPTAPFLAVMREFDTLCPGDYGQNKVNVKESIDKAVQEAPLSRWIASFSIPGVGSNTSQAMASRFADWNAFLQAVSAGVDLYGATPAQAESIRKTLLPLNLEVLMSVNPKSDNLVASSSLAGKSYLVTGVFLRSRDELKNLVLQHGGVYKSGVSKKLDYLVVGNDAGQEKLKKADALGVPCITEEEFLTHCGIQ